MPVTTASLVEQLAEGVVRGIIGGLADNADKLGPLVAGLTVAVRAGMASTAVDAAKPDPVTIENARRALAAAIAAGKLPNL